MKIGKNFLNVGGLLAVAFARQPDSPKFSIEFPSLSLQPAGVFAGVVLYTPIGGLFVGSEKTDKVLDLFASCEQALGDIREYRDSLYSNAGEPNPFVDDQGEEVETDGSGPMPEPDFVYCDHCENPIEFDRDALAYPGPSISCPLCTGMTVVDLDAIEGGESA